MEILLTKELKGMYSIRRLINLIVPKAGLEPARGVSPTGF